MARWCTDQPASEGQFARSRLCHKRLRPLVCAGGRSIHQPAGLTLVQRHQQSQGSADSHQWENHSAQ